MSCRIAAPLIGLTRFRRWVTTGVTPPALAAPSRAGPDDSTDPRVAHQLTNLTTLCKGSHDAIHAKRVAPTAESAPMKPVHWSDLNLPTPSATTILKFYALSTVFLFLAVEIILMLGHIFY